MPRILPTAELIELRYLLTFSSTWETQMKVSLESAGLFCLVVLFLLSTLFFINSGIFFLCLLKQLVKDIAGAWTTLLAKDSETRGI